MEDAGAEGLKEGTDRWRGGGGAGEEVGGTLGHQCPRLAQIKIEEAGRDTGFAARRERLLGAGG